MELADREPDNIAQWVDLKRDDGFRKAAQFFHPFDVPGQCEASRWIALQYLPLAVDAVVLHHQLPGRADLPVRLHATAKEILLGEPAAGESLPQPFGGGGDVGNEHAAGLLSHHLPASIVQGW